MATASDRAVTAETAEAKPIILVVDDEESMRQLMIEVIRQRTPYEPIAAQDGVAAVNFLKRHLKGNQPRVEMIVTDLMMPRMSGEDLLDQVRELDPDLPVMVVTSHGSIDSAVNLVRRGAADYLTKPFKPVEFVQRVERVLENARLHQENIRLREQLHRREVIGDLIGTSRAMNDVLKLVSSAAHSDALVMIYGESGTGKELIARAIHSISSRKAQSFVTVNCGALPESLLENELFGHVKGAYSDAHADRLGLVEEAEGGTLFLDEIGEITPMTQVKLLRFLQEKVFKRLGHSKVSKANVRIIAATNKDLREEVKHGRFREDLYYRLHIIPITLPPLRDRRDDIPLLANHFLKRFAHQYNRPADGISDRAMKRLLNYNWPGNIRELENKIQQVVVLTEKKVIQAEDIILHGENRNADLFDKPFQEAKKALVDEFERSYIEALLSAHRGNVSRAARQAGKDRRAFFELMRKHSIKPETYRGN